MKLRFRLPLIAVRDIERSKRFYCGLFGQEIVLDFGENVTFSGGFAIQADFGRITGAAEESTGRRTNNMELYFETDDIEAFVRKLEAWPETVEYLHGIRTHDWQQRVIRIYDPDGHLLEIGEDINFVIRRCLSEGRTPEETAAITQHPLALVLDIANNK